MTEQQPYHVIARLPGFELRRVPSHLVAEVTVGGSFDGAANKAFWPLFRFIGGRNDAQQKIAMTAPVNQESTDEPGQYVVSFVMPEGFTEETLPSPADPDVSVRRVPEQVAAVRRFTGRGTRRAFEGKAARLLSDVEAAGFHKHGSLRFARFNGPMTPWFLRHNEVAVPVAGEGGVSAGPGSSS